MKTRAHFLPGQCIVLLVFMFLVISCKKIAETLDFILNKQISYLVDLQNIKKINM